MHFSSWFGFPFVNAQHSLCECLGFVLWGLDLLGLLISCGVMRKMLVEGDTGSLGQAWFEFPRASIQGLWFVLELGRGRLPLFVVTLLPAGSQQEVFSQHHWAWKYGRDLVFSHCWCEDILFQSNSRILSAMKWYQRLQSQTYPPSEFTAVVY